MNHADAPTLHNTGARGRRGCRGVEARRRGCGARRRLIHSPDERPEELCALDDALAALEAFDARKARAVEYHYFGGMSHKEIATVLDVHENTVARDLRMAEAWIGRHIRGGG